MDERSPSTFPPPESPADGNGRLEAHVSTDDIPALVARAQSSARRLRFTSSCLDEVGRLLSRLAATDGVGTIGEIGSGLGVGTAWLASGLRPGQRLVTVESDPARAAAVRDLFAAETAVDVLAGDWRAILDHGPFAVLFIDAPAKAEPPDTFLPALAPGGTVVLDDLTPVDRWPPEWRGQPDPVRDAWLCHPGFAAEEVRVRDDAAVILARRRR